MNINFEISIADDAPLNVYIIDIKINKSAVLAKLSMKLSFVLASIRTRMIYHPDPKPNITYRYSIIKLNHSKILNI